MHDAAEVLARYVTWNGSTATFHAPDGTNWTLVTDPAQLSANSAGDGSFHPMPLSEVESALRGVQYPLDGLGAEVFILPYPRRDVVASSASGRSVMLTPGVLEYSRNEVHFVVTHELGHVVQFAWLPDSDTQGWARYRALRGITDVTVYAPGADHADRPHEIFAEDFRYLFGDEAARSTGGIENSSLELPTAHPEVRAFFLGLRSSTTTVAVQPLQLFSGPNPFAARTVLAFSVGSASSSAATATGVTTQSAAVSSAVRTRLAVYGPDGRMVRQLVDGTYVAGQYRVVFDGLDQAGRRLPPGVWFARLEVGTRVATAKLLLTR